VVLFTTSCKLSDKGSVDFQINCGNLSFRIAPIEITPVSAGG